MSSLPGGTYASPANSYYALASEGASNWYNFPSLTGAITLIDASGAQIIQTIGSNLYFNSNIISHSGNVSSVGDWALFPAVADIQMNNESIVGASNIAASTVQASTVTSILLSSLSQFTSSLGATTATIGTGLGQNVLIASGGITANGSVSANGLTTTNGLNMSNTAITNTTTIGISANGFPPYGQLSSPDGTSLTWNGAVVNTGGAGSASNWSFYPQLSNLASFTATQMSTASLGVSTINGVQFPNPSGDVTQWALNPALSTVQFAGVGAVNVSSLTGVSSINNITYAPTQQWSGYFATGDVVMDGNTLQGGTNKNLNLTSQQSNVNITSGNNTNVQASDVFITADTGASVTNTPQVKIVAQNGPLGGNIEIEAQPSFGALAGFGSVTINAYGSSNNPLVPLGGLISLNAYSGGLGDYGGLTSAVRATAATIALSAGALPAIPATAGTLNLYGNDIVSITAGLPGVLPQIPGTVYAYGPAGVNLESPFGITANNSFYTGNIYPIANGSNPLVIQGRSLPTAGVQLKDIELMNMVQGLGQITAVSSINNMSLGNSSLSNVSSIAVSSINGFAFPQTIVIPSTFTDFYASTIQVNSIEPLNGSTILITASDRVKILSPLIDLSGGTIGRVLSILGSSATDVSITSTKDINITALDFMNITGTFGTTVTDPSGITFLVPFVDIRGADLVDVKTINGDAGTAVTVNSSLDIGLEAANDVFIEAQAGTATLSGNANVNINSSAGAITLNTTTEVAIPTGQLNMTSNKITNLAPGTTTTDAVNFNQLTFRDATEFFVSAQGLDTNNGSILSPKLTIQAAITAAELISSAANICVINVASGHYVENLTFNKGYVVLTGSLQSQVGNELCEITGSITINCVGANDVFNRQVSFQGFNLSMIGGQTITNTSSASHTVAFQDCKVFVDNVFYTSSASSPDMRTYFTNMEITSVSALNTATVISTNVGLVEFERIDLTVNGNAIGIAIAGTSVLNRLSLSALDNTNTAVILKPLINITSSTTAAHSLGNVAFAFTSSVAKTNTSALAIASSIATAIIMLNCVFTLAGTAASTNFCVGYNGVGSPTIAGVNNTSLSVNVLLPQTTSVQSGITQIQYTNIDPPVLGTYSSSIDQTMAVGSTPQALTFNTSQNYHGTALVAGSRVYVGSQGNYAINYQCQLQNTSGLSIFAQTFLKKNGTNVANSASNATITTTTAYLHTSPQIIVPMNAGDYIEVWMNGPVTLTANALAASGTVPAAQSVLLNISQIR